MAEPSYADLVGLANQLSRIAGLLKGPIQLTGSEEPSNLLGAPGASAFNLDTRKWYGPKDPVTGWGEGIPLTQGPSAKAVVIAAGLLPADATDAQFATWLANSQIAAVQPYVDDAEAARDAAQAARTGAETAETNAETAATAAAADADATEADRAATESARDATLAAKDQAETAQAATAADRDATGADRTATAADRVATGEDRTAAHASAQSAAEDAAATAADRVATGEDRAAAAASAQAASDDAAATAADRVATGQDVTAADGHRQAAQTAQAAAEQARDEAQAIAGGDFQPQDATLTALAALDPAPGVLVQTGADAFAKRPIGAAAADDLLDRQTGDARYATPAAISAAISALVDGAPTALDTLKEIADALAADDDAIAALTLALDGKQASSATLTALAALTTTAYGRALLEKADAAAVKTALAIAIADVSGLATALAAKADLVGGKVPSAQLPDPPTVPVKASGAELRTATNDDKFLTPKSVADAAALVALTDAATVAVDLAAGTNFVVTLAGNRTLGAPSNAKPGMSGTILIKQDATGSRTLAYNTAWKPFGSTPSLTTTANAVDLLTWIVEDSSKVRFTLAKGGSA